MNCLKCGHLNTPSARYCARCGQLLPAVARAALAPGQTMDNGQYRVVRQLGKGGMGAVYIAQNTQAFDRLCVIKEMIAYYEPGQEARARERFIQEARILAALKHPNIPDMYGFFSEAGHNYIVMEYVEGKNLEQLHEASGSKLPEADVIRYGVEICRVLEYLASIKPEPVVHCDIKPANIIIEQNSSQAVLVDFGTARSRYRILDQAKPDPNKPSAYGTVGYAPPELYRGEALPRSDVFSLAATMYHLVSGDDPRDHPFKWPGLAQISAPLAETLQHALQNEVEQRPTAEQFRQELEALRASAAGSPRGLVFPDGNQATTLTGVLDLALRNWQFAKEVLYDGSLESWLLGSLGNSSAAQHAQDAVARYPRLPDGGLDIFLRTLNPRIPVPAVAAAPQVVRLEAARDENPSFSVMLSNGGPAGCRGTIACSDAWLQTVETEYALGPGEHRVFTFHVAGAAGLSPGKTHNAEIRFNHAVGQPTVIQVAVQGLTPTSALAQQPGTPLPARPQPAPGQTAQPGRLPALRRWALPAAVIVGLLGLAAYLYMRLSTPSEQAVRGALDALNRGSYAQAFSVLGRIPAGEKQLVDLAGQALDLQLVEYHGGEVFLGGTDVGSADGILAHPEPFSLQRFEVTNLQWQRYVNEGAAPPAHWVGSRYPAGQALLPVTGITWAQARAYADWAGLRLPTEAEWVLAARGIEGREHPWGDTDDPNGGNFLSSARTSARLTRIGSHPRDLTPEGVWDLAGNVREWTADFYGPYQQPHTPPTSGREIVVLGASFMTYDQAAWVRQRVLMDDSAGDLGFRCAR